MRYTKYLLIVVFTSLLVVSCSKLQDEITQPPKVGVHGEGTLNMNSPNFHGNFFINDSLMSCRQCHAFDYSGGVTGVGCNSSSCHPTINVHVSGILTPSSPNFHSRFLKTANWNILDCKGCHGQDYSGQIASTSCTNSGCHNSADGPEACNTCHGDFNNPSLIAPPQALDDSTSTTDNGVGAHTAHLFANNFTEPVECVQCHLIPQQFSDAGHIDATPGAELTFGSFATLYGAMPSYDPNTLTCSDSYCHGNFEMLKDSSQYPFVYADDADKIEGNNFSPIWNKVDGTQAACGTCHGIPPTGHRPEYGLTSCDNCHSGIVDEQGNILDKSKHINGVVNVFGN